MKKLLGFLLVIAAFGQTQIDLNTQTRGSLPGSRVSGSVPTADALTEAGTPCASGQAARGVDASGNAVNCFTPTGSGDVEGSEYLVDANYLVSVYGSGAVKQAPATGITSLGGVFAFDATNKTIGTGSAATDPMWRFAPGTPPYIYGVAGDGVSTPIALVVGNFATVSDGLWSFQTRSGVRAPADGYITLLDSTSTDFFGLRFGGNTSAFPMWKRNGAGFDGRLADDSGYNTITAGVTVPLGVALAAQAATSTRPNKEGLISAIPGACTVGMTYFATDETPGENMYLCTSTNTWTQWVGGGAGADDLGAGDPGSNGLMARTALNTTTARSIAAGFGLQVTNGDGVSGNPTPAVDASVIPTLAQDNDWAGIHAHTTSATQSLTGASSTIACNAANVAVDSNGDYTLTGTPIITDGTDGQWCRITNVDASNTITLTHGATNNLDLGGINFVLAPNQAVTLWWNTTLSNWVLQQVPPFGASVDDTEMTAEDFGHFTCSGSEDGCSMDNGVVTTQKLSTTAKTRSLSFPLFDPVAGDSGRIQFQVPVASTIIRVGCSVKAATSVTINVNKRAEATPDTTGTDVLSAGLVCDTNSQTSCTSGCSVNTITAGGVTALQLLALEIDSVSGAPDTLRVHVTYTLDDE